MSAALALLISAQVEAKDKVVFVEAAPVADKPTVTIDQAKAYIMYRSDGQVPLMLMKDPTPEDQARYDRLGADAFAEAREKYQRRLARWEPQMKAPPVAGMHKPDKPIEPTEKNFEFPAFGLLAKVDIGPQFRFAKSGGSTYLHAVTPGSYRIYGTLIQAPNGAVSGTCFCMGSVRFTAKAGEIVDLGKIDPPASLGDDPDRSDSFFTPAAGLPVDPRLQALTVRPVKFLPAGKLPNYFGVRITRVPAIPGVMRYDRDQIVDLTNGG